MRFFLRLALAGAALCGVAALSAPAIATLQGGRTALERFDYETALREFRNAAETGDAEAQYELAYLYYLGRGGIPQDFGLAAQWFGRAAEQGHAGAQLRLGDLHAKGQGVQQNYQRARQLIAAAAPRLRDAEKRYAESYLFMLDEYLRTGGAATGPAASPSAGAAPAQGSRSR